MTRTLLAAAIAAAALAAPVAAKGPVEIEICGATECRDYRWVPREDAPVTKNAALAIGFLNLGQSFAFAPPPPLAAYFRVQLESPGLQAAPVHVVPSAGVAERSHSWLRLDASLEAAFARAVAGLKPFPRPRIERALVNGRPSESPGIYAELFGELDEGSAPPTGTPSAEIRLVTDRPTPWTDGRRPLSYYPTTDTLRRPSEWVKLPENLAERIEADLAAVRASEGGPSWTALSSMVGLAFGLIGVGWMTLVRRRGAARRERAA